MTINDAHCHFFSSQFFNTLAGQRPASQDQDAPDIWRELKWDDPKTADVLADRCLRSAGWSRLLK